MKQQEARMVYFVQQTVTDEEGNYIPCIAIEGEAGYYKTDWTCGKDLNLAEKLRDDRNTIMGISQKEAHKIILSTMRL